MEEKSAENIVLIDLKGLSDFTDYFVIASANSERMLHSLARYLDENVYAGGHLSPVIDGGEVSGWIVLDYYSVVVHLLSVEKREYYRLEELWSKGKTLLQVQ